MADSLPVEELPDRVLEENDAGISSSDDSDSGESEADDDNVYGYPHDSRGRGFSEISQDSEDEAVETFVNNSTDSINNQGLTVSDSATLTFLNEENIVVNVGREFNRINKVNTAEERDRTGAPPKQAKRARVAVSSNSRQPARQQAQFVSRQELLNNTIPDFTAIPGPVRVWGGKCEPLSFFQLFWDDELFEFIKTMTNKNANLKRAANPDKHKLDWKAIETLLN